MYIISTVLLAANEFWDTNIINLINGIAAEIPNSDLLSASKKIAGVPALLYFSFIAFVYRLLKNLCYTKQVYNFS